MQARGDPHPTRAAYGGHILVVFIGAALAGILGMLLAIPVAACAKILFKNLPLPRVRQWAREH
jgi:predicted PurR-regulated permease PerM